MMHPLYFFAAGAGMTVAVGIWAGASFIWFLLAAGIALGVPLLVGLFYRFWWERRGWIFEITSLEETWDLEDPRGDTALVTKTMEIEFLRDNVVVIEDPAWGDGDLFAAYSCEPGKHVDTYDYEREKGRCALVRINPPASRGETRRFESRRTVTGGFRQDDEWIEIDAGTCGGSLTVRVIFPSDRPPRNCRWSRLKGGKAKDVTSESSSRPEDGRHESYVRVTRANPDELYRLVWTW